MDRARITSARDRIVQQLYAQREPGGWWTGELSASALSTATAISTLSFYLETEIPSAADRNEILAQISAGINWLSRHQSEDGGWGDTDQSYSNISTTMLVKAALFAAGSASEFAEQLVLADAYIESCGGIEGLKKRYGRDKTFAVPILANCAMAEIVPWSEVSALPFEAACVPQRFYNLMQLPVVSYAIPALVGIGLVKFEKDPPWDPFRKVVRRLSIRPSLKVLERMQPASGGYLEAVPLTSFVSMALIKSGRADHGVVTNGIRFIRASFRAENKSTENKSADNKSAGKKSVETKTGTWPIDTNLATWVTTLSINALAESEKFETEPAHWESCLTWLLECRNTKRHPFTGAAPGGWGWSDLSGAVPDADDTPGALLALDRLRRRVEFGGQASRRINEAALAGVNWLVSLQNRDNGWPTFCRGWGKLPFDRSGNDITAHAIRALIAWKADVAAEKMQRRLQRAVDSGFRYLEKNQLSDGSWLPLWFGNQDNQDDINPCYGTAKVLAAYRDSKRFDTRAAEIGLRYLLNSQNPDGGWGGGESVNWKNPELGCSSVEETALVVEMLIDFLNSNLNSELNGDVVTERTAISELAEKNPNGLNFGSIEAVRKGVQWLVTAVESDEIQRARPIGFYFAKLWYHEKLYPLIFATAALNKAAASRSVFEAVKQRVEIAGGN